MTCPKNIPGRQCLAGMRNTWLKKNITFPFIFRSMTIVRSLAVNGNFSIHYSAGLHVVCHGTVARQYQYFVSLTLSTGSFKENTRTVSCASQYFFYVISSQVTSFTVSKPSSRHLFILIPLLSKSLLQPDDTHSERAQQSLAQTEKPYFEW